MFMSLTLALTFRGSFFWKHLLLHRCPLETGHALFTQSFYEAACLNSLSVREWGREPQTAQSGPGTGPGP